MPKRSRTAKSGSALPITIAEARTLFADFKSAPAIVLAVSGGPDSTALLWLAARWRASFKQGPRLVAVTVDHGLRAESAREARDVKQLAAALSVDHRTLKWTGTKPKAGIPAAAREARYDLLARAAKSAGAVHVITAHTQDDQAETMVMRLSRGSGLAGLAAMAKQTPRGVCILTRPLLDVPKSRLIATLDAARVGFTNDPTNHDLAFTRPRLRALMPELAKEGIDARSLARLASRMARAQATLDVVTDHAVRALVVQERDPLRWTLDAAAFSSLPDEIRIRLLMRGVDAVGHEGPAELGKAEDLLGALNQALTGPANSRFKRSLAGAVVALERDWLRIASAPRRRIPVRGA